MASAAASAAAVEQVVLAPSEEWIVTFGVAASVAGVLVAAVALWSLAVGSDAPASAKSPASEATAESSAAAGYPPASFQSLVSSAHAAQHQAPVLLGET